MNTNVIAGLKWPPEMWPTAVTMTPNVRPVASATSNVPASACGPRDMIVPAPTNTRANAPTSSTKVRGHRSARGGGEPMKSEPESRIREAGDYTDSRTALNLQLQKAAIQSKS